MQTPDMTTLCGGIGKLSLSTNPRWSPSRGNSCARAKLPVK